MAIGLWEVFERTQTGERCAEKDFDMSIFRAADRLRRELDIKYDADNPCPSDDAAADRLWEAGVRFYVEVGTYCLNTGRVFKFSRDEIEEAIAACPVRRTIGEGKDEATYVHRSVEGDEPVVATGGIQTALFSSEKMAFKIWKGCAAEPSCDALVGGVIVDFEDLHNIVAGQPSEIFAYRRSADVMRRAVAAAGRPGMCVQNNAPSAIATIGMYDAQRALRPGDGIGGAGVSEMKMDYDGSLMRMAYGLAAGMPISGGGAGSVIGGFGGSIEGAAIVAIGGLLQGLMISGNSGNVSSTDSHVQSRSTRRTLWVCSAALQAVSRNTRLITTSVMGEHPAAGPGTAQYLYEAAAGIVPQVVSGGHVANTRKFNIGRTPDYGTPLESRWMGEVAKAAVGLTRVQANHIARELLAKYENTLANAPAGWTYPQLYDVEREQPKPEYVRLYEQVTRELRDLGLPLK